jgi:hypothetical protein
MIIRAFNKRTIKEGVRGYFKIANKVYWFTYFDEVLKTNCKHKGVNELLKQKLNVN